MIEFKCKNCGQEIKVPEIHSGKKSKCPRCNAILIVPDLNELQSIPAPLSSESPGKSEIDSLLDIPVKVSATDKDSMGIVDEHTTNIKEDEGKIPKRKFPRLIDIFLYPLSASGLVNIGIFLFVPIVINFLHNHVFRLFRDYGGILTLIISALFCGYMIYYYAECIRDSAKGEIRAPDISIGVTPDRGELLIQFLYLLGSAAICFWPSAVYYIFTEKADMFFWVLLLFGGFFFPMAILAVSMFGTISCLNPLLIAASVKDTFMPYCGMILTFYSLFGVIAVITKFMPHFAFSGYLSRFIYIYTIMIMTHVLGRFYYKYQEKLYWEV